MYSYENSVVAYMEIAYLDRDGLYVHEQVCICSAAGIRCSRDVGNLSECEMV